MLRNFRHRLINDLRRGQQFVLHDVWRMGLPGEPIPKGLLIRNIRVAVLVLRSLFRGDLMLRASSLTFAAMLSIVPFLMIMFFIIQSTHLGEYIDHAISPLIERVQTEDGTRPDIRDELINLLFRGLENTAGNGGESGETPVDVIIGYAERTSNPGALTTVGILFVLAAVFAMMRNVENTLNSIWGVKRSRPMGRMIIDYIAVLVLIPVFWTLAAALLSVTAVFQSATIVQEIGPIARIFLRGIQYVLPWLGFTILYHQVPYTRVRFRSALLAGIVAGTVWTLLSLGYVKFQFGLANYSLLYTTFAQIPMLLMWMFFSWLILLMGAQLSFAYQHERTFVLEYMAEGASYAYREAVALWAMVELGKHFDSGRQPLSTEEAAMRWNIPSRLLNPIFAQLKDSGLIVEAGAIEAYQPARSLDRITVNDIVSCMRETGLEPSALREGSAFKDITAKLEARTDHGRNCTLAELVRVNTADIPEQ